jgi:hypothetical protein
MYLHQVIFIALTFLLTSPSLARLGWTIDQCRKEYGDSKKTDGNKVSFLTSGGRTVNVLLDAKGIVQALEITPITRNEALNFKDEFGPGWITSDKYPDYSIIPDPEWAKNRIGDIHGTEWSYFPKNQLLLMNTEGGQIFLAKEKAQKSLNTPITPTTPEVTTTQGVSSIKQVRRIYVDSLGGDGESRLTREKIRAQLIKSKRFIVTDSPSEAQGIVQGAMATRSYTSAHGSSFEGQGWVRQDTSYKSNSTLRVVDAGSGKTLWTWEFEPATVYWGPFGLGDTDIAKSFVRDISEVVFGERTDEANTTTSSGKKALGPRRN